MEFSKKHRRIAAEVSMDSSAHPNTPYFDQNYANQVLGDLAEEVRGWLADKYDARPPGLQTQSSEGGTIQVIADNPTQGIGVQVEISLLKAGGQLPQEGMGVGPQPEIESSPFTHLEPGIAQTPQEGMGVGPQPSVGMGPQPGTVQVGPV